MRGIILRTAVQPKKTKESKKIEDFAGTGELTQRVNDSNPKLLFFRQFDRQTIDDPLDAEIRRDREDRRSANIGVSIVLGWLGFPSQKKLDHGLH